MPLDVRVVMTVIYCLVASTMLSLTAIHPAKAILFSLLTSAALFLALEKVTLFGSEQQD